MINRFSKTIWLILAAAFVVAGCEQQQKEETSVYELGLGHPLRELTDPNFVMPEYASRAIEATGGLEAWRNKKKLELDCVVTFYPALIPTLKISEDSNAFNPQGLVRDSFYLTEQHHEIYPPSNSVRISALELQGKFVWQLSGGIFTVLEGAVRKDSIGEQVGALPIMAVNYYFAEAILDITTAPVRFLDKSFAFTKGTKPVKIEGQWYYPIVRRDSPGEREKILADDLILADIPYWPKVVFCQNAGTARIDMLWFVGAGEEKFLAVRGYDYKEVEKGGILVPAKIEIFRTDADGVLRERLVKIDYYRLRVTE